MNDAPASDTADPARIFREMFPSPVPPMDWRLFCSFDDLFSRGVLGLRPRRTTP